MKQFLTFIFMCLVSISGYAQFCIPSYSTGTSFGDSIVSVQIGTLTGTYPGVTAGYNDYTDSTVVTLYAGGQYDLTIQNNPTYSITVEAWIDYNDDTTFALSEKLGSLSMASGATGTITFTIPPTAAQDTVRLRVMGVFPSGVAPLDPCGSYTYGETEDYSIHLLPPPPDDVAATGIAALNSSCSFSSNEPISLTVFNFGSVTQDTIPVAYSINGGPAVVDTIFGGLVSGDDTTFTFAQGGDFSTPGTSYTIVAWTSLPNDFTAANDTTSYTFQSQLLMTLPYFEDFETFVPGINFNDAGTFGPGWDATSTNPSPNFGWYVEEDGIGNSFGTGPIDDHTPGGSIYMFTESNFTSGDFYRLTSPCIDLTGQTNPRLSYWYHMFGTQMGTLSISVITAGGVDSIIAGFTGPQQFAETDPWLEDIVNLDWLADSVIQLVFTGVNNGSSSDMAIDDIFVYNAFPVDGLVSEILPPPSASCGLSAAEFITTVVKNQGSNTLDTIPMAYSINGGAPVIDTFFTSLISTDTALFTFAQTADLSQAGATFVIQAWTNISGDGDNGNDTTTFTIVNPLGAVGPGMSFFEDFETFGVGVGFSAPGTFGTLNNGWTSSSNSNSTTNGWHVEEDGVTNSGDTGPLDDHTPGGSIYMFTEASGGSVGDSSILTSPCIDLSLANAPRLSFWYHMFGSNMGTLEAHIITPNGFDSMVVVYTGPQHFNENDPWLKTADLNLDFVADSIIQIQFVGLRGGGFRSDMAIDDILLYNAIPTDAGALALTEPTEVKCYSGADTLRVSVVNFGSTTLDFATTNMDVDVDVTGASTNTYSTTVNTGMLPVGDTLIVTVSTAADFSAPGVHDLTIYTTVAGDINTFNDTAIATVEALPVITPPHVEDFETFTAGTFSTAPGILENGWTRGGTNSNSNLGWFVSADGFGYNFGTGPIDDHTNGGLNYMRFNSNFNANIGDSLDLISPCIDLTAINQPKLSFWYHMFGPNMGQMDVVIRTDVGETTLWSLSGQQQAFESDPWLEAIVDLSAFGAESRAQIIFRGIFTSATFQTDMAIDDINLFEPADFDVVAGDLISPLSGCGLTAMDTVCTEIVNFGLDTLDNIIASFSVDGGAFSTPENVPGILLPGDTMVYCFTTTADLSTFGTHDITVVTTQLSPADTVNMNDTTTTSIIHYTGYTGTFPYFQNFDGPGFVPDNFSFGPGAPVIGLAEGWINSQADGNQDWAVRSTATGSFGTGPTVDHTTGSTNYIFVDDDFDVDSVILISPCFDVSGMNSPKLSFWYHSNNNNDPNDENFLHIDLIEGSDILLDIIPPIGHKDPNWNLVELDMSFYGTNWAVRFRANTNNNWFAHDIAIDDFSIIDVLPQDAGITDIFTPNTACGLTANEDLTLGLANLGTDSILNGVTINYQISLVNGPAGAINSMASPNDTIAPGVTIPVIITNQDFSTPGTYIVTAWTSGLTGDTNTFNDSTSVEIIHIPIVTSYPYSEDFESGNGGWTVTDIQASTWELGAPNNIVIDTAASGVNAWITNANGLYNSDENGWVESPCLDFSALTLPKIEMAIWWESEISWDGAVLQSTIDNGATWVNVGAFGDPDNWYTDNTINGNPGGQQEGWTGRNGTGSNGWVIAKHTLDSLGGQSNVRLRVAFGSDGSVQDDGFAFDDIFIFDTPDKDIGAVAITSPGSSECSSDSTEVLVQVVNFGTEAQVNYPVNVDITGAATVALTTTVTDTIFPGDTALVSLGTFNSNVGGIFNLSGYTLLAGDTLYFNDSTLLVSTITTSATAPAIIADSTCADSSMFTLIANGTASTILWFDSSMMAPIHVGDTFNTGMLSQNTTYFAQAADFVSVNNFTPADNTIGGGGNYFAFQDGLVFDAQQDFTLNTVKLYPGGAGTIVVNVEDNSGFVIQTTSINYGGTAVDTTITLNFNIPQGTGYEINLQGSTIPGSYRNSGGASFPYSAPGIVDITNTINGLGQSSGFYYFFYDWSITALGCPSPMVPVTAFFLPDVPVDLGPDGTACEGLLLDAFLPQVATYLWSTSDTTPTITVNTSGTYYVDVVDINGCSGTDSINLFINPNPVVDLGADTVACDQLVLDAGNPGASYVWSIQGQFGQTVTITDTGVQTIYVDVTALGCSSSDTIVVDISEAPVVDLGADVTGCNPVPLDAGAANAGLSILWSTGETTQTIMAIPPATGSDTVTVTVTDLASGCETTDEVILTAGTPPVVDLGDDTQACDSLSLDAGMGGVMYLWSTGETTQTIVATTSGQYTVSVTDANGCEGLDTVNLTIDPSPVAGFTFNWVNYGFDFEFFDASANGDSVSWDFGDGSTSTDPNPLHTYQFTGSFLVTQVVYNDCGTDTLTEVVGVVSVDNELFGKSINVYPNPSTGMFWVEGFDTQAEELTIEVSDARGRLVVKHTRQFVVNGFKQQIDLTNEAEGVYVVKISDGEHTAIKRVMRK